MKKYHLWRIKNSMINKKTEKILIILGILMFIISSFITKLLSINTHNTLAAFWILLFILLPICIAGFSYSTRIKQISPKKSLLLRLLLVFILFCLFSSTLLYLK